MAYDIAAEVNDEIKKNLAAQEAADIQKEIENQRRTDFKSSMTVAAAFEPTKFAQALKVQRESGVPAKVAYDNADQIASLKQEAKFAGLFSAAPRTAEALSNAEHAILAKGDEENLLRMEKAAEAADFYKQGFFERQIAQPWAKAIAQDNIADLPARMIQLDRISSDFDKIESGEASTSPWAVQYQQADVAGRKQMRDNLNLQRNLAIDTARVAQYDISQMPVDPTERKFAEAEGFAESASALASDPMFIGRVAVQAIPGTAEGLAASLINPLFGGAVEGINAGNYKFMEVLQEKGIDPADPIQLMKAIRDDDLMQEANTRAARYGAGVGTVGALSAGLLNRVLAPTKFNGRLLSNRTREGINVLAQVPAQGALEAGGELTGQIAERGQLSDVDAKEVALEGIVGGVMSLPEVGAFGTKRFTTHMIQARRAERAGKLQADLVEKSLQSSTRKNDPASFEAIVSTQLAGRPNEYLEIPAAKLQELNQSGQVNIAELLENVGIDPEHYTAQVELGGTITIKNSAYLAYLAEQDEFLRGSIRVAGNEYTLDDVQEIDKQMLAEMEKIASQFGQTDQVATAYSDVMGQLLNSGYERGAADTTARQYAAVMTRLAEQTGQTVEEVMAANPLNIGRDVPAPVQKIREDQLSLMLGRLRAGDIPQPGDMFGKSLTEYLTGAGGIQDIGGELSAFDADVGKRGRNRLTRTDGMTPDDAAMQAWERGYFPGVAREDVTPNLLIDALREEAAGTPHYSVEQENSTLRDQAQSLEALQEYLDREGIDLATATDDEIRQRLGVQSGNQRLNQSAQTETQAFKDWFGDSKVVDADGKPLVVYHGTRGDFTAFDAGTVKGRFPNSEGFYFTSSPSHASTYADSINNAAEGFNPESPFAKPVAEGGNVIPVYVSLQNPKVITVSEWGTLESAVDGDGGARVRAAREAGHDGVIVKRKAGDEWDGTMVIAFRPEQIKSAIGNRGTFDPADPNILNQGDEETPRGSITFGPRRDGVRRFDIKLTAKSDLSTVLHEMGHYYLEVIGDLVQGGKANEALTADYAVIRDWLGAEEGKPLTVDQHEQFARGFEKYLAEGKAPSIELQTAFARFKRWLVGIYKDLKRLNVDLSPEIRSVFDRLLASQEAIDEAEQALALSQQFSENIQKIMTPEELANYARASQQARDDATDEIEREILKAERRKEQEWYREQRKAVEAEVRAELEAAPAYQARKYLFSNTPHPQTGKPVKLDTAAVTELFGTKSKQARFLGRARVKTGGMHPETAAFLLGYGNPVEMLADMMAVDGLSAAVKAETDRRMTERYPDPRTSGELAEKALAAVGEREAEVQAIQLRALAREAGRKATQHRIIKEAARQHIARLRLRDAIPYQYQRASAKAARAVEEALLAGNLPKAYEEKERQLMNLHLYREAVKAQDLAEQKRAQAKAYMKAGAKRKRLQEASTENFELAYPDGRIEYAATKAAAKLAEEEGATVTPLFNFLEQVDGLLQKYEFGIPRKAIRQQRETLQQFLAQMAGESIVVNPPEWVLLDRAERTNWKDLTIDQLVDVVDMIRQIDQMAKNKLFVLKGDKWAEYEPIRDAIAASIELNGHQAASGAFNRNFKDQIRKWGREWLGFLPADQIARELDGQDDLGPVQEHIVGPVQKAAREAVIREKAEMNSLAELVRQFYGDDDIKGMHDAGKLIAIPEIGQSMTRMQMVMLMANLGNEGNRNALLTEQRGIWTAETIQAVMANLDSNDADFVEALWAWVDKFWPEIAEAEAKRTGVAPAKVQGSPYPVKLADGKVRVLKGGYFPLKYDGEASIKTSQDDVGNAFKNMTAGRTAKAYTPDGHRIERVGSGGRPVKLDFSVLTGHVGNIVRDLTMTDPINQAWRFLHDTTVQGAFERANTKELHTALEIWMQDSAEGEKVDRGYMTASARWLRTGFTANVMLFNIANSLLNLAGTHPLVVLGKRWAMHGYRAAFMPANWEQMYELSSYMREARVESYSKDLALVQDQMAGKGGWRAAMTAAGFYLHNKTQQFMDAVVWMGAYEKGMSLDLVGQALIDYADQRVVEASGSGVFADRSALERGTLSRQTRQNEIVRGLTTLAGYMIRKMAIARRRTAETDFKDVAQAMTWAVDMALLFTVEGLMFAFVKGNVPDEDEDEQAKEWAKTAGWETFASVGSGLPPFGRPLVSAIQGFGGGSTSVDIFSEQFGNAIQQIKQGDADTTALKALVALTGTATKTPGIATNRVIDWLDRAQDGETPPWWELFTGNRNK